MENLYEILECSENASVEELKQRYQKLALKFHPDKNVGSFSKEKFIQIKKAWEILGDEKLREEYKTKWNQRKIAQNYPIHNEIYITDFDEGDEFFLTHDCRCGGLFILSENDVKFCYDIVCCDTCTLSVKVLYNDQT